jgi:hypothetical protein
MPAVMNKFNILTEKVALPLSRSLDELDQSDFGPYKVLSKKKIENREILKSLGTDDYIQWVLEDTSVAQDSPARYCFLFITYYELPDRVPHVPEECYAGGGFQRLDNQKIQFSLKDKTDSTRTRELDAKYLVFESIKQSQWNVKSKFVVNYLINANGIYAGSRGEARAILNKNVLGKQSFFSKVEWNFMTGGRDGGSSFLTVEQAISAGDKLCNVILPILEEEHWPSIEELSSDGK